MLSVLNEYMKNNRHPDGMQRVKRIECVDGFSMSVQAGEGMYCSPRRDGADSYWEVEVGYPSEKPKFFAEYAEGSTQWDEDAENYGETTYNYTDTVYGYVPIELVEQEIAAHGGIKK